MWQDHHCNFKQDLVKPKHKIIFRGMITVSSATQPTIVTKACPDCGGPNELTRGKRDGPKIIHKARIRIEHRLPCPQWLQRVRQHGGHPEISILSHETPEFELMEWAA
jgi:hypothetical protein